MHTRVSTSLQVYRAHIFRLPDGTIDASGVISRECYLDWLRSKNCPESDLEAKKYHRTLTNHVSGIDGRSPFSPEEEQAILLLFRRKMPWPCFPKHLASVGQRYRARGYHEKKGDRPATPPTTTSVAKYDNNDDTATTVKTEEQPANISSSCGCGNANVDDILEYLSSSDVTYLKSLGDNVSKNFSTSEYSINEWRTINQIIRYMILGKTARCCTHVACPLLAAQDLCTEFSSKENGSVVMVFDMTAKVYADRVLAQNQRSVELFGHLVGNPSATITEGSEIVKVVTAVGAAYHRPGNAVHIAQQRVRFQDGRETFFDMEYYVSPESYFMVIYGRPSSPLADTPALELGSVEDDLTLDDIDFVW